MKAGLHMGELRIPLVFAVFSQKQGSAGKVFLHNTGTLPMLSSNCKTEYSWGQLETFAISQIRIMCS